LIEINRLRNEVSLDTEQRALLDDLEDYIRKGATAYLKREEKCQL
jgi:hypothetical protein